MSSTRTHLLSLTPASHIQDRVYLPLDKFGLEHATSAQLEVDICHSDRSLCNTATIHFTRESGGDSQGPNSPTIQMPGLFVKVNPVRQYSLVRSGCHAQLV